MQLNAPRPWVFTVALLLGLAGIGLYFYDILGPQGPDGQALLPLSYYAFWSMAVGWLLLIAGSILRDL